MAGKDIESVDCALCGLDKTDPVYSGLEVKDAAGHAYHFEVVRCRNCGLCYVNPRPTEEVIGRFYPKEYYAYAEDDPTPSLKKWLRSVVLESQPGYGRKTQLIKRAIGFIIKPVVAWNIDIFVPYKERGKILDVGCGNGERIAWMSTFGWELDGVDISKDACRWAGKRGLQCHHGGVFDAQFPENYFDVVVINHVLEHLHKPLETLQECWRILKADGLLIIDVPNFGGFDSKLFRETWNGLDLPRHLYHFTEGTLKDALCKSGFKISSWRRKYAYSFRDKMDNLAKLNPGQSKFLLFAKAVRFSLRRWKEFLFAQDRSQFSVHLITYASPLKSTDSGSFLEPR